MSAICFSLKIRGANREVDDATCALRFTNDGPQTKPASYLYNSSITIFTKVVGWLGIFVRILGRVSHCNRARGPLFHCHLDQGMSISAECCGKPKQVDAKFIYSTGRLHSELAPSLLLKCATNPKRGSADNRWAAPQPWKAVTSSFAFLLFRTVHSAWCALSGLLHIVNIGFIVLVILFCTARTG